MADQVRHQGRNETELPMLPDRPALVHDLTRPVPRAQLSARATLGLWVLRVLVTLLSAMVVYTFVVGLH